MSAPKFDLQGLIAKCDRQCVEIFSVRKKSAVASLFEMIRKKGKLTVEGMMLGIASERGPGMYEITFSNLSTTKALHLFLYDSIVAEDDTIRYDAIDRVARGGELILPLRSLDKIISLEKRTLVCNSSVMKKILTKASVVPKKLVDLDEYISSIPAAGGLECNACRDCSLVCTKRIATVLTVGLSSASSDVYGTSGDEVWSEYKIEGLKAASAAWLQTYISNTYKALLQSSQGLCQFEALIEQIDDVKNPMEYSLRAKAMMEEMNAKSSLKTIFEKVSLGDMADRTTVFNTVMHAGGHHEDQDFHDQTASLAGRAPTGFAKD